MRANESAAGGFGSGFVRGFKSRFIAVLVAYAVLHLMMGNISCAPGSSVKHRGPGVYHVVKPGQTLYRIALTYRIELKQITRANGISDPSRIEVGRRLLIPGARRVLNVPVFRAGSGATFAMLPCNGAIVSYFGAPRPGGRRHEGVDIDGRRGTEIRAVMDGVVIFSGKRGGYGLVVYIRHDNGYQTRYAHNSKNLVKRGQRVRAGQRIALMGDSGNATSYHVHFELRRNGVAIDPLPYLGALAD